ncbi:hypothetical protein C7434_1668 [Pantoea sp. PNA 14-12]|nr:hypothetical protein C7433_103560 [Pantoea sp. PNA 03-3]TDS69798.1 hypothetical protein C7434_1668 [Pantoea sp. PNA 14-12]
MALSGLLSDLSGVLRFTDKFTFASLSRHLSVI